MALGQPPYHGLLSHRVLFLIPRNDPPILPNTFSKTFRDFVSSCLQKDPTKRSTAKELLKHPLFKKYNKKKVSVVDLLNKSAAWKINFPSLTPNSYSQSDISEADDLLSEATSVWDFSEDSSLDSPVVERIVEKKNEPPERSPLAINEINARSSPVGSDLQRVIYPSLIFVNIFFYSFFFYL